MDVEGCRYIQLPKIVGSGGTLSFVEQQHSSPAGVGGHIPFEIRRVYFVYDLEDGVVRGGHAHRDTEEITVAIGGSFEIHVRDRDNEKVFKLSEPNIGLYMPELIWREFRNFRKNGQIHILP